jgi:hypothetical protein
MVNGRKSGNNVEHEVFASTTTASLSGSDLSFPEDLSETGAGEFSVPIGLARSWFSLFILASVLLSALVLDNYDGRH